jgi:hypothetical protein
MEANPELYHSLVNTAIIMGEHNEHAEIIQRGNHYIALPIHTISTNNQQKKRSSSYVSR